MHFYGFMRHEKYAYNLLSTYLYKHMSHRSFSHAFIQPFSERTLVSIHQYLHISLVVHAFPLRVFH